MCGGARVATCFRLAGPSCPAAQPRTCRRSWPRRPPKTPARQNEPPPPKHQPTAPPNTPGSTCTPAPSCTATSSRVSGVSLNPKHFNPKASNSRAVALAAKQGVCTPPRRGGMPASGKEQANPSSEVPPCRGPFLVHALEVQKRRSPLVQRQSPPQPLSHPPKTLHTPPENILVTNCPF